MRLPKNLARWVWAFPVLVAAIGLAARPATAQLLIDTFTDGIPGNFWNSESGNPAIQVSEIGGQLRLSCWNDPSMSSESYAGYTAKNWRLRSTNEFRLRVTYRANPVGINYQVTDSKFGIGLLLYDCEEVPAANRLRKGMALSLGALTGTGSWTRDFNVDRVTVGGDLIGVDRWYAFPFNPTYFYWQPNPDFVAEIPIQGNIYIRYNPFSDSLSASVLGYNDPNALVYNGISGYGPGAGGRPVQVALGGFARRPGGTSGNDTWLDDFRVDFGVLETAPVGFAASDGTETTKVRLTWPAALGTTGYRIKRSTGGTEPTLLATLASNAIGYDDTSAEPAVLYTYTIETMNPSGPPFAISDTGFRNVPAPAGLVASDGTLTEGVSLAWSPVAEAIGYRVERRLGIAAAVEVGVPEGTSFVDESAVPGLVYTYFVRARIAAGNSPPSSTDTGWRALLPPTGLVASDGGSTANVGLSWQAVTGATGYRVFRAIGAATPTQISAPTTTTFNDASAVPGTIYTYTVKAFAASGLSAASEPDLGWRNVAAPAGLQASDGTSDNGVNLAWTAASGALSYRVYRAIGTGTPELIASPTANSAFDDSAEYATVYSYTVRAVIAAGETGPSVANAGWRNIPAPTGLVATDGVLTTGVDLAWNVSDLATGYRIYRAIGNGAATQVGQTAANGFADTTAAAGTLYTYTVRATTAPGNSAPSAADTGWRNRLAPTGVAATDGTLTTGVRISWVAVPGAAGYRVFRAIPGETPVAIAAPNAGPYLDATAIAGEVYSYTVTTRSVAGDSGPSLPDTGYRGVPAPTGVAATDGTRTDGVEITWTAVPGATGYRVFRKLGSAAAVEVGLTGSNSFLDEPVPGTVFTYTVRAGNATGESVPSAANNGWRNLPAPTGLAATDGSLTNGVNLAWSAVPGATGYRVFRAIGSAAPAQIAAPAATATAYLDATAVAGTTYTYSVRAVTAAGNSDPSLPDTGWKNVVAPANLQASNGLTTGVNLTWTASPGAAGYRIYRSIGGETPIVLAAPTAASFLDTTADVGVTYTYEVRARTASGESNSPNPTRTGSRQMPAPTGIAASDGTSASAVVVTWNPIPGVSTYRIFRANGTAAPTTPLAEVGSVATYEDSSAVVGTIYNYTIRGVFNGTESASGGANTGWRTIAAPASVAATDGASTANVTVSWSAVPGTLDYRVFRAPAAGGSPIQIGTVNASLSTFLDTTASPGQPFRYTVRARTTPGMSLPSESDTGWRDVTTPANFNATLGTVTTGVNLTWTATPGANGYRVLRGGSEATLAPIAQTATATFPDVTAEPGVTYQYRVQALTPAGPSNGVGSAIKPGWRNVPAPGGFAASDGTSTGGVNLSWNPVAGASSYLLDRGVGNSFTSLGEATETAFADVNAAAGTVYTYRIRAKTPSGNSLATATDTGWRGLPAPQGVAASDGSSTASVTVGWTSIGNGVPGHTGYRVYRSAGGSTFTLVGTVAAGVTSFTDTTAIGGTLYTYAVRSRTAAGESANSAPDTGWRNVLAPANLQATDGTRTDGVNLTWTAVTGATSYRVLRGTGPSDGTEIGSVTTTAFLDTTAQPGITFHYSVKAVTQGGPSAASAINTGWRNVPAPTGFLASDGDAIDAIELEWTTVEGAIGYEIYRAAGSAAPAGAPIKVINDPMETSYEDVHSPPSNNLPAGSVFNYVVKAKTAAGLSAASAANTGWRNIPSPAYLFATAGTSIVNVSLEWPSIGTGVQGHTGYRVYRRAGTAAPVLLATVPVTATGYVDATAAEGFPYAYTVASVTAAGNSQSAPEAFGFRNVPAPTGVVASDDLPTQIKISWLPVNSPAVIGYKVYIRFPQFGFTSELGSVSATTTVYTVGSAAFYNNAEYAVQALTLAGGSDASNWDVGSYGGSMMALTAPPPADLPDGRIGGAVPGGVDRVPTGKNGDGSIGNSLSTDASAGSGSTEIDRTVAAERSCAEIVARIEAIVAMSVEGDHSLDETVRAELAGLLVQDPTDPSLRIPACTMYEGDVNLDGSVDEIDLAAFLAAWADWDLVEGDLDRDGMIDARDLDLIGRRLVRAAVGEEEPASAE